MGCLQSFSKHSKTLKPESARAALLIIFSFLMIGDAAKNQAAGTILIFKTAQW